MDTTPSNHIDRLSGTIERVTFHSEETGFCVLQVKVKGQKNLATVIGNAACVSSGEYIESKGEWVNSKRHGLEFKATELKIVAPTTLEGIEKYLGSGMVKGIGPHFAKKLVRAFGDKVFETIEQHPEKLTQLEGIGAKRKQQVISAWSEQKSIRDIMVFLQSFGIGTTRAVRIYKTYGDSAIEQVRENPYRLSMDVRGFGFKIADQLASKLGIASDAMIRIQAGVCHVLKTLCGNGHCAVPYQELIDGSQQLLDVSSDIVKEAIELEIAAEHLSLDTIDELDCIYLVDLLHAEIALAQHIKRLQVGEVPWGEIASNKAISWVEDKTNIILSNSQKRAIDSVINHKFSIITGGPGVGKTTIVNSLLKVIRAKSINVALCAPTGRAAKRLTETTGMIATTIHRLLEYESVSQGFHHNEDNPLPVDVLIVDETSMLDLTMAYCLLSAIPDHAAIIFVGDIDQLPSVGAGAVLQDMIESGEINTVFLTEIFRQSESSKIILNAHRINHGKTLLENTHDNNDFYTIFANSPEQIHEKLVHLVQYRLPSHYQCDPIRDIQVLTPMNRGGLGTRALNVSIQSYLNGQSEPQVKRYGMTFSTGDKVIQMVNNYDKEVFNGDIGFIQHINLQESQLTIQYDNRTIQYEFNELDEIQLAYAITIHKSQGSEFPIIVIPLSTQHYPMLARNLLYTAITRGKSLVVLVAERRAVELAIENNPDRQRLTGLKHRVINYQPHNV